MNAIVRALLIAAFAWSAGCGDNGSNQIPLSQCLFGWYLEPPSVACTPDTCGTSMPAPECGFKDCTAWGFEGFLPGGVYYFGGCLYSAQSMSMSGTAIKQTWAAASDGYTRQTELDPDRRIVAMLGARGTVVALEGLERAEVGSGEMRSVAMERRFSDGESDVRRLDASVSFADVRSACARTGTRWVEQVAMALRAAQDHWSTKHDVVALSGALSELLDVLRDGSTSELHRRLAEV